MIGIRVAEFPGDIVLVRELFREYAAGLGVDLAFQQFEAELENLPGKYVAPAGCVLLAFKGDAAIGCIALRPVDTAVCEMKRLYLRPQSRGLGISRALVERLLVVARGAGYRRICLDTLPSMLSAQALYASFGFVATTPYVFNPVPGTQFLALDL